MVQIALHSAVPSMGLFQPFFVIVSKLFSAVLFCKFDFFATATLCTRVESLQFDRTCHTAQLLCDMSKFILMCGVLCMLLNATCDHVSASSTTNCKLKKSRADSFNHYLQEWIENTNIELNRSLKSFTETDVSAYNFKLKCVGWWLV